MPRRRSNKGTRPVITGEDPLGPEVGRMRMVIAMVVQKAVQAIFKTNTYSFSNKYFLQMKGGPTGCAAPAA